MKKYLFLFLLLSIFGSSFSQVVINEIMYAPVSANSEWFELYNLGSASISLKNWKWIDATNNPKTITSQNIFIPSGGFVVICDDSNKFKSQYSGIQGIYVQSNGWNILNNSGGDLIYIYDSLNLKVDSVYYYVSWGGGSGHSLERINPAGPSNLSSNWGQSIDPLNSTPLRQNSLTPKSYDLILNSFNITPQIPVAGDSLKLDFTVKNIGLNMVVSFILEIYFDSNHDSIPQPNEKINNYTFSNNFVPNDSVKYLYSISNIDTGLKQYIGVINYPPDQDTLNNKLVRSVYVSGSAVNTGIVINEILYDNLSPEPEWIELYNNSSVPIDIKNWQISDSVTNPIIITSSSKIISDSSYLVISKTGSVFNVHNNIDSGKVIVLSNLPTLNNDRDRITLYNNTGAIVDFVSYKSNWGGAKPNSLERKSPAGLSNDSTNWGTSIDCEHSSPTRKNSLTNLPSFQRNDIVINEIMYDPFTGDAEWVEMYNPSQKSINLNGWRFLESSGIYNLFDTCNFIMNPGDYLVLAKDTTIYNRYGYMKTPSSNQKIIFRSSLSLSNDGELIEVLDISGNVIDSVNYSPNWHNPNIADEKGYSLERINPLLNSNDRNNWSTSAGVLGGTAGMKNSIYTDNPLLPSTVTVSPNPFSPDGDGFEDFTIIRYKLTAKIVLLRVKVFDVKGRLVRTLENTQISGSEGTIIFNGLNDNGEKLRIGIYVLFIEAIDDRGGTVEQLKTPVVIAAKL